MTGRQRPYLHVELFKQLKRSQRRDNLLASTKQNGTGQTLTKEDMGYEIEYIEAYHPASLCIRTL